MLDVIIDRHAWNCSLESIINLPLGFPINNIISLELLNTHAHTYEDTRTHAHTNKTESKKSRKKLENRKGGKKEEGVRKERKAKGKKKRAKKEKKGGK